MLNFAETDFSQVEDINEGGKTAPDGTLVRLLVKEISGKKTNQNGKAYFVATFEVTDGQYTGKIIKENYYLDGKPFALQKTELFARYVLETTTDAHKTGDYGIDSPKKLEMGHVIAKLGMRGFYGENGDWIVINEVASLSTPREDSSTFKYWEAYENKEQPFITTNRPEPEGQAPSAAPDGTDVGF